jgi:hypothetical protein
VEKSAWQHLKEDAVPFSIVRGSISCVDISSWLHIYCNTDTAAAVPEFWAKMRTDGAVSQVLR